MATKIYIDGIDVLATYEAYPTAVVGILEWPSLKEVKTYDWPDEDGMDVDLSHPVLASRQLSLPLAVRNGQITAFMEFLYERTTRTWEVKELGYSERLRLVGCSDFELHGDLGFATILLSADSPMEGYTYEKPSTTIDLAYYKGALSVDNVDLTSYGCTALEGVAETLKAYGQVKEALLINVSNKAGVVYDNEAPVRKAARTATLGLLMRANSIAEFWRNYNALLYDLTREGERTIAYNGTDIFKGYYSNMSIDAFDFTSTIWVKFIITFNETGRI